MSEMNQCRLQKAICTQMRTAVKTTEQLYDTHCREKKFKKTSAAQGPNAWPAKACKLTVIVYTKPIVNVQH